MVEPGMSETDMVHARQTFSMEMIRIRMEWRLANPDDSEVEAEELEAVEEAEAAVLESHDDDLGRRMEEEQFDDDHDKEGGLDLLVEAASATPGEPSATSSAVDLGLELDQFETQSHASGPADSEGMLSEDAYEDCADDEAVSEVLEDEEVEDEEVDVEEDEEVDMEDESVDAAEEADVAVEEVDEVPIQKTNRSDSPDPGDNISINKTGPWLPLSAAQNPKPRNPFIKTGNPFAASRVPIERFGPLGTQAAVPIFSL